MKINTLQFRNNKSSPPSKISAFVQFLVKIRYLPVTVNKEERKIRFRLMSTRTWTHIGLYLVSYTLWSTFYMVYLWDPEAVEKISEKNIIEKISTNSGTASVMALFFPLVLARGLDNVDLEAFWDQQLPFPQHGIKTLLSYLWMLTGSGVAKLGYILQFDLSSDYTLRVILLTLICMYRHMI